MLNQVPNALRIANRVMVMRHPNSMDCQLMRKAVTRTAGAEGGLLHNLPTLGGLGVMDNEDEAEVEYSPLGNGRVLFVGRYAGSTLSDRRDNAEAEVGEAMIEPETEGAFEPRDGDLVMAMPGGGVVITYEVTKVFNAVNIPPYLPRYELTPQGDMTFIPGVADSIADRT